MLCEKCEVEIQDNEVFNYAGQKFCEDCYIEKISIPKTCDPMKVRSAKLTREMLGQKGTEGLLPIQREIYNYLKDQGSATRDEVAEEFDLDQKELEKHFSVLRHCEMVRGFKEGGKIYLTIMDSKQNTV